MRVRKYSSRTCNLTCARPFILAEGKPIAGLPDLKQTALAQPALFVVEFALARLWMRWGVKPEAMIGHSIGEFVAACLAGVFSLEDALGHRGGCRVR